MLSINVTCVSCETKNLITPDLFGLELSCVSCDSLLPTIKEQKNRCLICQDIVNKSVNLSNGYVVHNSCLKALHEKQNKIESDLLETQFRYKSVERKIEKSSKIGSQVVNFFRVPLEDTEELNLSKLMLWNKSNDLKSQLDKIKSDLFSIYDYFLTYPPDWEARRELTIMQRGEFCSNCGATSLLHIHHTKPLSKGGSNQLSNLIVLCQECHSIEHGGKIFTRDFSSNETAFSNRVNTIQSAIKTGKKIVFGYKKETDKKHVRRTVRPAQLVNLDHHRNSGSTLCVKGYCELRKSERVFALKRMRGLKTT